MTQTESTPPSEETYQILIIEEDRDLATSIQHILESHDYTVKIQHTARDGIYFYASHYNSVQIVIIDHPMEEDSGYAVLKALLCMNKNVKVLAISSLELEPRPLWTQKSVRQVLTKPFSQEDILEAVAEILAEP